MLVKLIVVFLAVVYSESCLPDGQSYCQCDSQKTILDCRASGENKITKIPKFPESTKTLYLDDNNFSKADKDEVNSIGDIIGLTFLSLKNCKLSELEFDLFDNLENLLSLDLSENNLEQIDDDTFEWNPLGLEILKISFNKFKYIQHYLLFDLEKLQEIYLDNNQIAFIHPYAFQQNVDLRKIDLSNNHLHTFNPAWVKPFQDSGISHFNLQDNPWSCDCANEAARTFLKSSLWMMGIKESSIICKTDSNNPLSKQHLSKYDGKSLEKINDELPCEKPKITGISKSSTIAEGKTVLLKCIATGLPKPTISWIAPDKDVYRFNNNNFEGIAVDENGSLKITNLRMDDAGDYVCQASNFADSEEDDEDENEENKTSNSNYMQVKMTLTVASSDASNTDTDLNSNQVINSNPDIDQDDVFDTDCPTNCGCINSNIDCSYPSDWNMHSKALVVAPEFDKAEMRFLSSTLHYYLSGNLLHQLPKQICRPLKNLIELRADDNLIRELSRETFRGCDKLQMLSLRKNKIEYLEKKTFYDMEDLTHLYLDENSLVSLDDEVFANLKSLQWLYIRKNDLQTWTDRSFYETPKLEFIHFEDNALRTLNAKTLYAMKKISNEPKLFLEGNPFICDCYLKDVYDDEDTWDDLLEFSEIECQGPDENTGKNLAELDSSDLRECSSEPVSYMYNNGEKSGISLFYSLILVIIGGIIAVVAFVFYKKHQQRFMPDIRHYTDINSQHTIDNDEATLTTNQADREVFA